MIMQDRMVNELGGCLDGHTFSWGMEQLGRRLGGEAVKAPNSLLVILVSSIFIKVVVGLSFSTLK